MKKFEDLMNEMRQNPSLYLVKNDVYHLEQFFMGLWFQEMTEYDERINQFFYDAFPSFVNKYLHETNTEFKWCEIIRNQCENENQAFELFFEVFDAFLKDQQINIESSRFDHHNIFEYITHFRMKPELFIMKKELSFLYQHLYGYGKYVKSEQAKSDRLYKLFRGNYYFLEYVDLCFRSMDIRYQDYANSIFFSKVIQSICDSDKEAMGLFYKIYDQLIDDYKHGLFTEELFTTDHTNRQGVQFGRYMIEKYEMK